MFIRMRPTVWFMNEVWRLHDRHPGTGSLHQIIMRAISSDDGSNLLRIDENGKSITTFNCCVRERRRRVR